MARQRNNEIRQKILEAAYNKFTELGFETVLIKDIAEECGISKSLLHHYFSTKKDIVIHIIFDMLSKTETFVMDNYGDYLKNHTEYSVVYNSMLLNLFYDILSRNNNKLLRMYVFVLCDANLMYKVIDYSIDRLIPFTELKNTFEKRYGLFVLNGSLAQTVLLYLNNNLAYRLTDAIDKLLVSYYRSLGFTDKQQKELINIVRDKISEDDKNRNYEYYINSLDNFILCDWA